MGLKFLNYLIDERRFEDAARLCTKIYGRNKDFWEAEAYRFAKIGQLKVHFCLRYFKSLLVYESFFFQLAKLALFAVEFKFPIGIIIYFWMQNYFHVCDIFSLGHLLFKNSLRYLAFRFKNNYNLK